MENIVTELQSNSKKFNKVVIWGLRRRWHTHRFIFEAYYQTLKKCNIPVIWVEDDKINQKKVEKGDILFTASGMHGKMVPQKTSLGQYNIPIRDDVFYCLHAEEDFFIERINPQQYVLLKYYSNEAESYKKLYECVHFDSETQTLYQPWGTNLLPHEFKKPIFIKNNLVFWIGSIWKGKMGEGNIENIDILKNILKKKRLLFIPVRFVPNFINIFLVRHSRISPAIGGKVQVEQNYLPCRMFKNISYGQLGFSNIKKFNNLLESNTIYNENMEEMVDSVLKLSKEEYLSLVEKQQSIVKRYTIAHNLNNIFKHINP